MKKIATKVATAARATGRALDPVAVAIQPAAAGPSDPNTRNTKLRSPIAVPRLVAPNTSLACIP